MCQRQEHLSGLATTLPDVVFDYRVLAQEPVLICQAVKDTPGRVTLLLRQRLIVLQDTVNHSFVRVELRPAWWLFPRYPGGAEYSSILLTVLRRNPNTWAASRMLIPSTKWA